MSLKLRVLATAMACCSCADRTISEVPPVQCWNDLPLDFSARTDAACIEDASPAAPGAHYECSISDVQRYGSSSVAEQLLVQCDGMKTRVPCWQIVIDSQTCLAGDHLAVTIERAGLPPPDANLAAGYCAACMF